MDKKDMEIVTPFDQLTSSANLRMMKLMIPYVAPESQRFLAVYIRFMELQNTIRFFEHFGNGLHTQNFGNRVTSPMEIFQEIAPYMPSGFSETFEQISNMLNMMEMMQTFQNADADPVESVKQMFSPEQQEMFDMYSSMFSQGMNQENENEGDEKDERLDE